MSVLVKLSNGHDIAVTLAETSKKSVPLSSIITEKQNNEIIEAALSRHKFISQHAILVLKPREFKFRQPKTFPPL